MPGCHSVLDVHRALGNIGVVVELLKGRHSGATVKLGATATLLIPIILAQMRREETCV